MTRTAHHRLPERYETPWRDAFHTYAKQAFRPGVRILDVGSGRQPAIHREARPPESHYVGLDLSRFELELGAAAYDEYVVSDVARYEPALSNGFDLAVSWQVLEHVTPLDEALENLRTYLKPGGRLVAMFAGTLSAFGIANRMLPQRVAVPIVARAMRREPDTIFPAYYDRCYDSALRKLLPGWSSYDLEARYRGADYFKFAPPLQRAYLAYENWACRNNRANLATHYLLMAEK